MLLIITKHAAERMVQHGITKTMVEEAIKRGSKTRQTDGYLATYTYFKVAYKMIGEEAYKVKTVIIK